MFREDARDFAFHSLRSKIPQVCTVICTCCCSIPLKPECFLVFVLAISLKMISSLYCAISACNVCESHKEKNVY